MNRVLLPLAAPARPPAPPSGPVEVLSGPTMGVAWTVRACLPPALPRPVLQDRIQALLNRLVMQMSPWEPQSDITRYNRSPAGAWVAVPAELFAVVEAALSWAESSDGAFDPTLGRLVDLWGFGTAGPAAAAPDAGAVQSAAASAGWRRLQLDRAGRRLLQPGGLSLDLSGIAKGFAVDAVSRALSALGVGDHLVEIGGECRGSGLKPGGEPWWVLLEPPPDAPPDLAPIVAGLFELSVATSGDYRQGFTSEGQRYSHTLDGRTGAPVRSDLASATVVHTDAMTADALATVLLALGSERAAAFAAERGIAARLLARSAGALVERFTPAMAAMLE